MFGRIPRPIPEVVSVQNSGTNVPTPHEIIDDGKEIPDERYLQKARDIGIISEAITDGILKNIFKTEKILIYPYVEVTKFLRKMADQENTHWYWIPVRVKDMENAERRAKFIGQGIHAIEPVHYARFCNNSTYPRAIPDRVLQKITTIVNKYPTPNDLVFYIGDYRCRTQPDPFLAVTTINTASIFVIDHWDEPGFRIEE